MVILIDVVYLGEALAWSGLHVEKLADGFGMGPEQLMAAAVAEIPAP